MVVVGLCFSLSFPAEISPEDEGKNGSVVGPLTDWTLALSHSTAPESLPIQVQHCDVAGGENLEAAMEAHTHLPVATNSSMTKKMQSTSLPSPTKRNPSKQGKNRPRTQFAKSTTPPFPDRPLLSPILILLRSWLHWINIQSCRRPFHCRSTKRAIYSSPLRPPSLQPRESGDRMSLSADSRLSKVQYLTLTDGLVRVTA
jgi:hypothetical protein